MATPSAEQVRRPIFRDALNHWRSFEPWLGPLKEALVEAKAEAEARPAPDGYDRAVTLAAMSYHQAALEEVRPITLRAPSHPGAWRLLAKMLRLAENDREAEIAEAAAARAADGARLWRTARDRRPPERLVSAEQGLSTDPPAPLGRPRWSGCESWLFDHPADAAAVHLLASSNGRIATKSRRSPCWNGLWSWRRDIISPAPIWPGC